MKCPTTSRRAFYRHGASEKTGNEVPYYEQTGCDMPEFISSPIFLIIAAVFAIFLIIGIIKHAWRFLIWIAVIAVILIGLGIVKQSDLIQWFESLRKMVE